MCGGGGGGGEGGGGRGGGGGGGGEGKETASGDENTERERIENVRGFHCLKSLAPPFGVVPDI